jgi:hypothetical protein
MAAPLADGLERLKVRMWYQFESCCGSDMPSPLCRHVRNG